MNSRAAGVLFRLTMPLYVAALLLCGHAALASAQDATPIQEAHVDVAQNKQIVQRLFDDVFNRQDLTAIEDLYAPHVVDHSAFPDQPPGVKGITSAISGFFQMFDSLDIAVEDMIAEGDRVATREKWTAVHAASGDTLSGVVMHIFRIGDGRITEEWSRGWDWLGDL